MDHRSGGAQVLQGLAQGGARDGIHATAVLSGDRQAVHRLEGFDGGFSAPAEAAIHEPAALSASLSAQQ